MKIRLMYAIIGLIFGVLLSGSFIASSDIVGISHWQQKDSVLMPVNESLDVGLNNNSLIWADLSSFAGDNVSWDSVDMAFDVTGAGFGAWNQVGNILYTKVDGADVQLNGSLTMKDNNRIYFNPNSGTYYIGENVFQNELDMYSSGDVVVEGSDLYTKGNNLYLQGCDSAKLYTEPGGSGNVYIYTGAPASGLAGNISIYPDEQGGETLFYGGRVKIFDNDIGYFPQHTSLYDEGSLAVQKDLEVSGHTYIENASIERFIYANNDTTSPGVIQETFRGFRFNYPNADGYFGNDNVYPGYYVQRTLEHGSNTNDNSKDYTNLYQGDKNWQYLSLMWDIPWDSVNWDNGVTIGSHPLFNLDPVPLIFMGKYGSGPPSSKEFWLQFMPSQSKFMINGTTQALSRQTSYLDISLKSGGAVRPGYDDTNSLGTQDKQWSNVYSVNGNFSSGLNIPVVHTGDDMSTYVGNIAINGTNGYLGTKLDDGSWYWR